MTIPFSAVPSNLRVPFVAAEFDASRAQTGPAEMPYRALLIGQKTSGGSAADNSLHRITNADQVIALAGRGSQLHRMAQRYFKNNRTTETYIGVLADVGAGVAASGTLTVTGPASASGTLYPYIGGRRLAVAVASGDAQNTIAAAIKAAIDADLDLPVTATVATNVVTITAKNKGLEGNDIDVRLNYQDGERTPAGVAVAIVEPSGGTSNPTLASLIAAMGDTWFHIIAHPYTDATSLTAIEAELLSRTGPMRMIDGVAVTSASGTHSTLATLGGTRNSQHTVILAQPGESPVMPPSEYAAAVAAQMAFEGAQDPALPLQTVAVEDVLPPAEVDLFTVQERNLLLYAGIATTRVGAGGKVQLDRVITTYKTNAAGASDTAYLDVTSPLTLMYLRYTFRNLVQTQCARMKLADDGTRVGQGQRVITPKVAKGMALHWFRQMEEKGLVERFDAFEKALVVERNATDRNRLDFLLPVDLINGFIVGGVNLQFSV